MRIEQLIHLKKIAETGSINLASKNLFITQQALSQSIIKLEKELGVFLLNRSKSGVSLTVEGEFVLKEGDKIIAISENIRNHFLQQQIVPATYFNISSTSVAQHYLLNKPISYFYKNFPEITINVSVKTSAEILQDMINDRAELGFLSELIINAQSDLALVEGLSYVPLFASAMDVMFNVTSSLAKYKKLSVEQLEEQTIILLKNPNSKEDIIYKIFQPEHFPKVIIAETEQLFAQMIKDDLGCAFFNPIADFITPQSISPYITTRPLEQSVHITFGYVVREENYHSNPFIPIFCDHLW